MELASPVQESNPDKIQFTHLHTHSHFSLLDGAGKLEALIERAKEYGMTSLALTDHGAMYGIVEFYELCLKKGIKPILGVEAYLAPRTRFDKDSRADAKAYHQLLLAETFEGYQNLIKLTSEAHLNGFYYKPRIDKDLLRQHSKGLIATSSCLQGEIPRKLQQGWSEGKQALEEFLGIFGEKNFFLELQPGRNQEDQIALNDMVKRLAAEYKIPLIATNDIHYVDKEDSEAQDVLVCVQSGKTVNDPNRLNMTAYDLSMFSPEQMLEQFPDTPEALTNTALIAERCNVEISLGKNILPVYPTPEPYTDRMYLRHLCEEGVKTRYGFDYTCDGNRVEGVIPESPTNDHSLTIEERVIPRLEYELSVIEKMGYESYFLIVQDFLNWARSEGIAVGPGRGSGAGSIVSYLTGITDLDPLHYDLIFERFLNPERVSMPDIDSDIEDSRRDEVIEYVRRRYGADRVAQIITFGTMASRAAVRDVGRALGVSYADCDYIAKLIPSGPGGMSIKDAIVNIPDLKQLYESNDQFQKLLDVASRLEGVARHTSIHAAGVVITKEALTEYVPLQRAAKNENIIVTQYAMSQVEHLGLLKMDFLGLANLGIIQKALRIIEKTRGVTIDLLKIPIDDAPSYELLSRAESTGVFQLESAGMKRYLKELKPTRFEDIISMVALYRPGPMDAIPDFIASKHGRKAITYLHPLLEPTLKSTYGIIVTQDQVLEIARKFAGFSYAEADILRKAVGKKIKSLLDEQSEKFISRAAENPAITREKAAEVWNFIEPFARYGFNRAHAACYAMIAYQTAYLKAHYPVEFMAGLMTSDLDNLERIGIEIAECREMGIEVLPPDVNESFVEFGTVFYADSDIVSPGSSDHAKKVKASREQDSYIRFGLGAIKNVGLHAGELIVQERKANGKFLDFPDFLRRNAPHLNKKVLENLAMAGAFDSLMERQMVLSNIEAISVFVSAVSKGKNTSQFALFDEEESHEMYQLHLHETEPASPKVRLQWELELLGIYLSDHPISTYLNALPPDRELAVNLTQYENNMPGRVAGIIMGVRKILTKTNQDMAFVQIEDESGQIEAIFFPRTWKEQEKNIIVGEAIVLDGKISRKDRVDRRKRTASDEEGEAAAETTVEEVKLLVDSAHKVQEYAAGDTKQTSHVAIRVPEDGDRAMLQKIKGYLEDHPGKLSVSLLIPTPDGDEKEMPISHRVELNEHLYSKLAYLVGSERVLLH